MTEFKLLKVKHYGDAPNVHLYSLNAEIVEWLHTTKIKYKTWSDIKMEEPYTGFVLICYYIGIDDPEHAMLFKLAWM